MIAGRRLAAGISIEYSRVKGGNTCSAYGWLNLCEGMLDKITRCLEAESPKAGTERTGYLRMKQEQKISADRPDRIRILSS